MKPAEDKPEFEWRRITAEGVEVLGVEGPPFDHDEHRDKFFVFVSASQAQEGRGLTEDAGATILASPYLISLEHPEECFEFWFYIKVRKFEINTMIVMLFHKITPC